MSFLTIIVATDRERGIGINNTLPWHLPEDLAHFKRTTSGHTIIMGRKTFDSIGRALPQRRNIVITRNPDWKHGGVDVFTSIDDALKSLGSDQAFIIGGAEIYAQTLPLADQLIVTEVDQTFSCDAFFPLIEHDQWQETSRETHFSETKNLHYAFVTYKKLRSN